jgi:hypothetical protein
LEREELDRESKGNSHQEGKATVGSKADRGNGCKDMKSAEAISGSKAGSENGWIGMTFGTEVMKIYCRKERNRTERAKVRSRRKGNSGKQSRHG